MATEASSPRSQSPDSVSESSHSYEENHSNGARKRRRISNSEQVAPVEIHKDVGTSNSAPLSRVLKSAKAAAINNSPHLEETEVNNGKIVDAKSSFATLGASPWLIASLGAMEIRRPTAIQKGCIPEIIAGKDVIGGSRTGSGKTVAFTVPILQKWSEDPMGVFAVILTPTR